MAKKQGYTERANEHAQKKIEETQRHHRDRQERLKQTTREPKADKDSAAGSAT